MTRCVTGDLTFTVGLSNPSGTRATHAAQHGHGDRA